MKDFTVKQQMVSLCLTFVAIPTSLHTILLCTITLCFSMTLVCMYISPINITM